RPLVTKTDTGGSFQFSQVPVGTGYTVAITATGFRSVRTSAVNVELGKATAVDTKLEVGQVSESVVVSGVVAMVDTQSSSTAITVDRSFYDLLPKGRSFYDLLNIAPGARNEGKSGGYEIDGASGSENIYYLD